MFAGPVRELEAKESKMCNLTEVRRAERSSGLSPAASQKAQQAGRWWDYCTEFDRDPRREAEWLDALPGWVRRINGPADSDS
jgi:hypothetical protein